MKTILTSAVLTAFLCAPAMAQEAPEMYKETYPDYALGAAMGLLGALEGDQAAIDMKTMQLIQLGVAAQIPCTYCIYFHTRAAKAAGASDLEIKAAVAAAADTRMWSTVLNGNAYDMEAFKAEVDTLVPLN
ncbi:carboxymuconolactone decarboxylase family protein [Tropicimonas sp. IMCC6043]|uniref:carboxymuconolactone decarboxylase family protein n=1 Tax=Tropicimonas sp. IMCC6043 TaxID=2510645 RepID=UPI00101BAD6B|nr:carboxymuconolactone decarboxylase family protein [Tropicimonas sp. IMCC6043]RYH11210.1 carboxymuconolactone decarboxylase family protein [Tropicimonas sp. IMCC6043]